MSFLGLKSEIVYLYSVCVNKELKQCQWDPEDNAL